MVGIEKTAVMGGAPSNLPLNGNDSESLVAKTATHGETEYVEINMEEEEQLENLEHNIDPELLNMYGCPRTHVTPRVLVIKDQTKQRKGRQFADYNVLRRDALIAQFLNTKSDNIPIPTRVWNRRNLEPELVVIANDDRQALLLLGEHQFGPFKVKVEAHPTRNSILGKVFDRHRNIERMGEDQAAKDLEPQGVSKVEKLGTKGQLYKITFSMYERPPFLRLGRIQVEVEEFLSPPLRCFRCQTYGHGSNWNDGCTNDKRCKRCGGDHDYKIWGEDRNAQPTFCTRDRKCVHCEGPHDVGYYKCPREKEEQNLVAQAARAKVTVPELRRQLNRSMSKRVAQNPPSQPQSHSDNSRMDRMEEMLIMLVNKDKIVQRPSTAPPNPDEHTNSIEYAEGTHKVYRNGY